MSKTKPETVRCPGCGGKQAKRTADAIYWCGKCQCQFDNDPDEGGFAIHNDPVKAASSREEYQRRRAQRGGRR